MAQRGANGDPKLYVRFSEKNVEGGESGTLACADMAHEAR
jgi:hypothetical protein